MGISRFKFLHLPTEFGPFRDPSDHVIVAGFPDPEEDRFPEGAEIVKAD
jgi:hypothetical protein